MGPTDSHLATNPHPHNRVHLLPRLHIRYLGVRPERAPRSRSGISSRYGSNGNRLHRVDRHLGGRWSVLADRSYVTKWQGHVGLGLQ